MEVLIVLGQLSQSDVISRTLDEKFVMFWLDADVFLFFLCLFVSEYTNQNYIVVLNAFLQKKCISLLDKHASIIVCSNCIEFTPFRS